MVTKHDVQLINTIYSIKKKTLKLCFFNCLCLVYAFDCFSLRYSSSVMTICVYLGKKAEFSDSTEEVCFISTDKGPESSEAGTCGE